MYTEDILRELIKSRLKDAEDFFGDVICEAVDMAIKDSHCEISVKDGKVYFKIWHDLEDAESRSVPFMKFELEDHLSSTWPDDPKDARYDQKTFLEIADALEALAKRMKEYVWEED